MIRIFIFSTLLCCLGLSAKAQASDDILMIVAGKMISVADFQTAYQRNNPNGETTKERIEEYLKYFVDYQLQVAEAEVLKLDTLRKFRQEMTSLFSAYGEKQEHSDDWKQQFAGKPCVQVEHLFIPLRQQASFNEQQRLRACIDSVYNAICNGADFMQVAKQVSQGQATIEWLGRDQTLAEIEAMAFRLSEGELSSPLLSTDGFHLMQCIKVGVADLAAVQTMQTDTISTSIWQEYRAGLLIQMLYDKEMREKAQQDVAGLHQYFTERQKQYAWDAPRFKGIVYQSKDKKTHKMVKKLLTKQPMERWQKLMEDSVYQHLFQNVKASPVRMFVLGEDAQVDELAFGGPKTQTDKHYPLRGILGKEQKKYPDSIEDVKALVVADYQAYLERQWLDDLRKRHEVTINEKALKQIYQ